MASEPVIPGKQDGPYVERLNEKPCVHDACVGALDVTSASHFDGQAGGSTLDALNEEWVFHLMLSSVR